MPKETPKRKSLEFDLNTNKLADLGFKGGWGRLKAYSQLKKELIDLGFQPKQKSVYYSTEKMTLESVHSLIKKLDKKLPWLERCIKEFDVADVAPHHGLTTVLHEFAEIRRKQERTKNAAEPKKDREPKQDKNDFPMSGVSLSEIGLNEDCNAPGRDALPENRSSIGDRGEDGDRDFDG